MDTAARELLDSPEFRRLVARRWRISLLLTVCLFALYYGYIQPMFPLRDPAIVSMSLAFLAGIAGSLLSREPSAEIRFDDEKLRTYLGMGAE